MKFFRKQCSNGVDCTKMTSYARILFFSILLVAIGSISAFADTIIVDEAPARPGYFPGTVTDGAPKVKPGMPIKDLELLPNFYQTPNVPFILASGEQVIPVTIDTCSGEEAQKILDDECKFVPEGVYVVTVEGTITVSKTPLVPKSRTCFIFSEKAKIVAAPDCQASELVLVQDTELISFSAAEGARGIIDGAGTATVGIRVQNSGRVHIDRMEIVNCGEGGLMVVGCGEDRYAEPVSLTRSKVSKNKGNGVTVRQSPQFIALDNIITGNSKSGLEIDSQLAVVANNICAGNEIGLQVLSSRSTTTTRNQLIGNKTGLDIHYKSNYALVYENTIQDNELGVKVSGMNTTIAWNTFAANKQQIKTGGIGNVLQTNFGLSAKDAAPGTAYFNPPTMGNLHKKKIIWQGEGDDDVAMERYDLTIESGKNPMTAMQVTERLRKARDANPTKVLVARLKGDFIVRTNAGLKIPDYTCILIEGTITNEPSEKQRPYLVSIKGKGCVSLSGGKITSKTSVFEAVSGTRGNNTALVDGVYINLYANTRHIGSKSINGVSTKQHKGVFILRGCEIHDSGSRGIWAHVSERVYTLGNRFYGSGMTIDFDAFCFESSALYNTVSNANYHSAIFFEEGVKYNTAFANRCLANKASAIQIWTQATELNTEKNLIACNEIAGGAKDEKGSGFSIGANTDHPLKKADNNYIFNNRFDRCNGRAAINIKLGASNNYFGQNVFGENKLNILNFTKGTTYGYAPQAGFASPNP